MENSKAETAKKDEASVKGPKEATPKGGGSDSSRGANSDAATAEAVAEPNNEQ